MEESWVPLAALLQRDRIRKLRGLDVAIVRPPKSLKFP